MNIIEVAQIILVEPNRKFARSHWHHLGYITGDEHIWNPILDETNGWNKFVAEDLVANDWEEVFYEEADSKSKTVVLQKAA